MECPARARHTIGTIVAILKTDLSHIASSSDILENDILKISDRVLQELLKDHSATRAKLTPEQVKAGQQVNIFWATEMYEQRYGKGRGYDYHDPITIEKITGENGSVVQPRVNKTKEEQQQRSRDKAEVFTPSWICNKQNNLIDNAWFGRDNVFNTEIDSPDGTHTWQPTAGKIAFPNDPKRTWSKYVSDTRLEITCGEAPYLVSRYDTITGEFIPLHRRIGLLDRKMRVVNENTSSETQWWYYTCRAYQSTYGFDWQGDNVLLAREALFFTFLEYYIDHFGKEPSKEKLQRIAYIISWNIWQMDGLKFVVPDSCKAEVVPSAPSLFVFPGEPKQTTPCRGCASGDPRLHNGIKCLVRDWFSSDKNTGKRHTDLPFYELINR